MESEIGNHKQFDGKTEMTRRSSHASEDCGKEGLGVVKILDQSGAVIVLGDMVFIHFQQNGNWSRGCV
ncbi:hypothetical protein QQ045_014618 [Rhodiola kirilowii]